MYVCVCVYTYVCMYGYIRYVINIYFVASFSGALIFGKLSNDMLCFVDSCFRNERKT